MTYLSGLPNYKRDLSVSGELFKKLRLILFPETSQTTQVKSSHASMLVYVRIVCMKKSIWEKFCKIFKLVEDGRTKDQKSKAVIGEFKDLVIAEDTSARRADKLMKSHAKYVQNRYVTSLLNIKPLNKDFWTAVWHCNLTPAQLSGFFDAVITGDLAIALGKSSAFFTSCTNSKNMSYVSCMRIRHY